MKIFRKKEGKVVAIDTNAYNKMQDNIKSKEKTYTENAMRIEPGTDPVFGKLEYYLDSQEGVTRNEEQIKKLKEEIKKFYKY